MSGGDRRGRGHAGGGAGAGRGGADSDPPRAPAGPGHLPWRVREAPPVAEDRSWWAGAAPSPTRRPDVSCPQGWLRSPLPVPPLTNKATACTREGLRVSFGCGSEPVADAEVDVMEQDLSLQDIVGT